VSATANGRSYWNHAAKRPRVRRAPAIAKTDGLLASRWFWAGGLLSIAIWAGIAYAAISLL
jgi:hypothetical protein